MQYVSQHMNRARRGFSLVELVIVIIIIAILAVAIFAGGSVVVKKSQVSRTISDLHNFSVAVEATLNENPNVANIMSADVDAQYGSTTGALVAALNKNLPADYQLTSEITANVGANIKYTASTDARIFKSAKTDSWGNPYMVIFDLTERSERSASPINSEFYITVVSAGPNAITELSGKTAGKGINNDDIFLLAEYKNGDVAAITVDCSVGADLVAAHCAVDAGNAYASDGGAGGTSPFIF